MKPDNKGPVWSDINEISKLLEESFDISSTRLQNSCASWYQYLLSQLKPLADSMTQLAGVSFTEKNAGDPIKQLTGLLDDFRRRLDDFRPPSINSFYKSFSYSVLGELDKSEFKMKEEFLLPITDDLGEIDETDSRKVQSRKNRIKRKISRYRFRLSVKHFFSREKPDLKQSFPTRKIPSRGFFHIELVKPVLELGLSEWNQFNFEAFSRLSQLKTIIEPWETKISGTHKGNESDVTTIQDVLKSFETLERNSHQRIQESIESFKSKGLHSLKVAGTSLLNNKKFRVRSSVKTHRKIRKQYTEAKTSWQINWNGELKEVTKDVDLLKLMCEVEDIQSEFVKTNRSVFQSTLENSFSSISEEINKIKSNLNSMVSGATRKEYKNILIKNRKYSYQHLDTKMGKCLEFILEYSLFKKAAELDKNIKRIVDALEPQYVIFKFTKKDNTITESKIEYAPIRELIHGFQEESTASAVSSLSAKLRSQLITLSNELELLSSIADKVFETAQIELKKESGESDVVACERSNQVMVEGLDRCSNKLLDYQKNLVQIVTESADNTESIKSELIAYINSLRESEHLLQLKLSLARSRAGDKFTAVAKRTGTLLTYYYLISQRRFKKIRNNVVLHTLNFKQTVFRAARITVASHSNDKNSVEKFLTDALGIFKGLPIVYQRLFRFSPMDDPKLFIGRSEELKSIERALTDWREGRSGLLALVGEKGSGRSSMVQSALSSSVASGNTIHISPEKSILSEEELLHFLAHSFGHTNVSSLDELSEVLGNRETETLVIMEDIHKMFLKSIDGIKTFNTFLLFATRTHEHIFWFITCGLYTWRYLDKVLSLENYFSNIIELKGMPAEELNQAIIKRHRLSGFPLQYIPSEQTSRSRAYRSLKDDREKQAWLNKQFFHKIFEVSGGNVSAAMLLWLFSLKATAEGGFTAELSDFNINTNSAFSDEELFAITSIIQHEQLDSIELAKMFSIPDSSALLILTGLTNRGVLVCKNGNYELHFFLYPIILKLLYEKRYLH